MTPFERNEYPPPPFVAEDDIRRQFEFVRILGQGDVGRVFLCRRIPDRRYVALKVFWKTELIARKKLRRIYNEYLVLAHACHPNLATLQAFFQTKTKLFFVLDFVRGGELYFVVQCSPHKILPIETVRIISAQLILALRALHMIGVVYRDLKPENVLLTHDGRAVLTDFDLVAPRRDADVHFVGEPLARDDPHSACPLRSLDALANGVGLLGGRAQPRAQSQPSAVPSAVSATALAGMSSQSSLVSPSPCVDGDNTPGGGAHLAVPRPQRSGSTLSGVLSPATAPGASAPRETVPAAAPASLCATTSAGPLAMPSTDSLTHARSGSVRPDFAGCPDADDPNAPRHTLPVISGNPGRVSIVGTREYMAPEVLKGKGHDRMVDFWTIGILLYELLVGHSPFRGSDSKHTVRNIFSAPIEWPERAGVPPVPAEARDLIGRLLDRSPSTRLGCVGGWGAVMRHPFFDNVLWEGVAMQRSLELRKAHLRPVEVILQGCSRTMPCRPEDVFVEDPKKDPEADGPMEAADTAIVHALRPVTLAKGLPVLETLSASAAAMATAGKSDSAGTLSGPSPASSRSAPPSDGTSVARASTECAVMSGTRSSPAGPHGGLLGAASVRLVPLVGSVSLGPAPGTALERGRDGSLGPSSSSTTDAASASHPGRQRAALSAGVQNVHVSGPSGMRISGRAGRVVPSRLATPSGGPSGSTPAGTAQGPSEADPDPSGDKAGGDAVGGSSTEADGEKLPSDCAVSVGSPAGAVSAVPRGAAAAGTVFPSDKKPSLSVAGSSHLTSAMLMTAAAGAAPSPRCASRSRMPSASAVSHGVSPSASTPALGVSRGLPLNVSRPTTPSATLAGGARAGSPLPMPSLHAMTLPSNHDAAKSVPESDGVIVAAESVRSSAEMEGRGSEAGVRVVGVHVAGEGVVRTWATDAPASPASRERDSLWVRGRDGTRMVDRESLRPRDQESVSMSLRTCDRDSLRSSTRNPFGSTVAADHAMLERASGMLTRPEEGDRRDSTRRIPVVSKAGTSGTTHSPARPPSARNLSPVFHAPRYGNGASGTPGDSSLPPCGSVMMADAGPDAHSSCIPPARSASAVRGGSPAAVHQATSFGSSVAAASTLVSPRHGVQCTGVVPPLSPPRAVSVMGGQDPPLPIGTSLTAPGSNYSGHASHCSLPPCLSDVGRAQRPSSVRGQDTWAERSVLRVDTHVVAAEGSEYGTEGIPPLLSSPLASPSARHAGASDRTLASTRGHASGKDSGNGLFHVRRPEAIPVLVAMQSHSRSGAARPETNAHGTAGGGAWAGPGSVSVGNTVVGHVGASPDPGPPIVADRAGIPSHSAAESSCGFPGRDSRRAAPVSEQRASEPPEVRVASSCASPSGSVAGVVYPTAASLTTSLAASASGVKHADASGNSAQLVPAGRHELARQVPSDDRGRGTISDISPRALPAVSPPPGSETDRLLVGSTRLGQTRLSVRSDGAPAVAPPTRLVRDARGRMRAQEL
eukprot:TRINITY_DN4038_c0_g1_i1.p1 TRINITY_DN4038_c0_g1~~TRINITY_DN4038_c0_g1_i1.p1  ORF type:complete len:1492 (-),score=200.56 TRINITY_DN4038_c0_g1_i1:1735-6210(-)